MRGIFWCIIGILFVFSITAAFAQQEQQPDTVPVDSQVKQDPLTEINKTLGELKTQIAVLNTKVNFLMWAIGVFFTVVALPVIIKYWQDILSKPDNSNTDSKIDAEVVTENQQTSDASLSKANQMDAAQSDPYLPEE